MAKKLIIFDLDGTLYSFEGGSFSNSGLSRRVHDNAVKYIAEKLAMSAGEAEKILLDIKAKYGEDISLGLEKEYALDRYDYFNTVWDIGAKEFITQNNNLSPLLERLAEKYILTVVSDAPRIWVDNVLAELQIAEIFADNIFTGEGDERKGFGNSFVRVLKKHQIGQSNVIAIGDQELTDIIPAAEQGMSTIFVGPKISEAAMASVKTILDLEKALVDLERIAHKQFLLDYLMENSESNLELKQLNGSSDSTAFKVKEMIFKVGPIETIQQEFNTYQRFNESMTNYRSVFPGLDIVFEKDGLAILKIEYLGGMDLENFLLEKTTNIQLTKLSEKVLEKIGILFDETKADREEEAGLFFEEILAALRINLQKAGLDSADNVGKLAEIKNRQAEFTADFVASLCHKDLSTGNIIINDENTDVRFIDPRLAIPYLEQSSAMGNVVIDLVGYYVSIERKLLEIAKRSDIDLREVLETIEKELDKYEGEVFSPQLRGLSFVYWYSVYAACKCDYCTAPERLWLYDEMVTRTIEKLKLV